MTQTDGFEEKWDTCECMCVCVCMFSDLEATERS